MNNDGSLIFLALVVLFLLPTIIALFGIGRVATAAFVANILAVPPILALWRIAGADPTVFDIAIATGPLASTAYVFWGAALTCAIAAPSRAKASRKDKERLADAPSA